MDRRSFEKLVEQAIAELPAMFRQHLTNVAIIVEDKPSKEDLEEAGIPQGEMLLGLYVGTPLTERGSSYGLVPPDTIIIFQKPI
ncbi:MAG: metallopeptidase family protein, partial [Chloroflexi bacterium]|nr:metallopeptidase family protein [Chloroflexota bacterium]